ncbi:hypothetical protein HBH92_058900 [Parastagonospora nodorum]|nr:hypothetical protein HBH92_058900 [Parastagonospora nodorum]KAH4432651.1 hypothetical protein HBH93_136730 [Parastagonospora nodorum]KAH4457626.1 hypothetical protein HBH91_088770 [Parastagonospora nodorum]KAH4511105.1 hypothetical protein HBH89_048000 [Parastagonospora nodorum]KAH4548809.1 hypothetical protein HBH85_052230 [Parastagonospora nodorum]
MFALGAAIRGRHDGCHCLSPRIVSNEASSNVPSYSPRHAFTHQAPMPRRKRDECHLMGDSDFPSDQTIPPNPFLISKSIKAPGCRRKRASDLLIPTQRDKKPARNMKTEPIANQPHPLEHPGCAYTNSVPPAGSFDELVTVRVGRAPHIKEYQIHQGLLAHHSTIFASMFLGTARTRSKTLALLDVDPEVFETVKYWLYTTKFWAPGTNTTGKIPFDDSKILQLYFFANDNGMQELQNVVMKLFYQKNVQDWAIAIPQTRVMYVGTRPESPLRRFLVDMVAETWGFKTIKEDQSKLPKDFLVDVLVKLRDAKMAPGTASHKQTWIEGMNRDFCEKYHVHTEEK